MRSSRRGVLIVAFIVSLFASSAAVADEMARWKPTQRVALAHFKAGNQQYRIRAFERAIEEYKAGLVLENAPLFHYNLAQCYRQLGKYEDAIWHYERFVKSAHPTGEMAAAITDFIAQMKSELEKKATTQAPTEAEPKAIAPPPAAPPAPPANEGAAPASGMPVRRKLALAVAAGGVAALGIGIGVGIHARGLQDDAKSICPMVSCDRSAEANDLIDRGERNALYANIAFGVSAVAVAGAAVLWLTSPPSKRAAHAVTPHVAHGYFGLAGSISF